MSLVMNPQQKSCIIYCRTSTAAQKEADTIKAQLEVCSRIASQNNLKILPYGPGAGWLEDNGVRGSLLDGRVFSTFLDDLEGGIVHPDYIVIYSLSRIARIDRSSKRLDRLKASHAAAARIQAVLIGCGVQTWDQDGPLDAGSLMWGVKILLASEEYKEIRRRTMDGKARRLKEGSFSKGGKPPFGYKQVGDHKSGFKLEPDPVDAPNLCKLFNWYLAGGFHFAADRATEEKIQNPMSANVNRKNRAHGWTPSRWNHGSVKHIVRNVECYLGSTEYSGHQLKFDPLIDIELCARVQAKSKERSLKHPTTFLSTGFADCVCKRHIHQNNSHDRYFTACRGGCGSMPSPKFEVYLWTAVVCRLAQIKEYEGITYTSKSFEVVINRAKAHIETINGEISTLLDLHLRGGLD